MLLSTFLDGQDVGMSQALQKHILLIVEDLKVFFFQPQHEKNLVK